MFNIEKYCVYMHIFPNNKKYIGIAKEDRVEKRWGSNGCGYLNNRQPAIEYAIKKYGWENIKHVILKNGLSKSESKSFEIEYIKQYNTYGENGYNLTPGGDNNTCKCGAANPSAKAIIYCGERYVTLRDFCKKYKLKEATVSSWLNGHSSMPYAYYNGQLHYEGESMELIQPYKDRSGSNNSFAKIVIFNNKEYGSVKEFCEQYKVSKDSVRNWISGKYPMPQFFYDNGLHYKYEDISKIRRSTRKDKYIHTDSN